MSALRFFLFTFFVAVLALPTRAQNTAPSNATASFAARIKTPDRLEGTIQFTSNGLVSRAKLQFQAPDRVRLEIEENAASATHAEVIVARENETRLFDSSTHRIQRLPFNIARQWFRGSNLNFGGPGNFLIFGLAADALGKFYAPPKTTTPAGAASTPATAAASALKLEARPEIETRLINDYISFGGGGDRISYAPFKRLVFERPEKISIQFQDAQHVALMQTSDGQSATATIALQNNLPQSVVVNDNLNREISRWEYKIAPRAAPFDDKIFSFDLDANQIIEDAILRPPTEYSGADASSKWNLGEARLLQSEDAPAAFAAWDEAARLAPQATAPRFSIYEAALAARDLNRAQSALDGLSNLLGANNPEVLARRAELLLLKRDESGAQAALETALAADTKDSTRAARWKIALAQVLRGRGDETQKKPSAEYSRARDLLMDVLKSDAPSGVQTQAAATLCEISWNRGDEILQQLPSLETSTLGQNLARAGVLALQGKAVPSIATDDLAALAFLGTLHERAGNDSDAIAAWQKIVARAPWPDDKVARLHLVALFARRGEIAPSLEQYRALIDAVPDLKSRREFQEFLILAWRKTFRQNQLKLALQQRAVSRAATEDDARLWLSFQENYGALDDVHGAIQNGLARFPRSAWWRGREAEYWLGQVGSAPDTAARDALQRQALDYAEQAISLDANQPYYAAGRAVILAQRATPITGIIEAGKYDGLKKIAFDALDASLKKWPDDPDLELASAALRLPLEGDGHLEAAIQLLQTALVGGAQSAGADRHLVAFSARQVLVSALRRQGREELVPAQYEILFRASRSVGEELGVAVNLARWRLYHKDAAPFARDLMNFAREPWSFDDSQQLLQPLLLIAASKSEIGNAVFVALKNSDDPYAKYVAALLTANAVIETRRMAASPDAPVGAELAQTNAEKTLAAALRAIEPLVEGDDKILASRVAALLGEQALNRGESPAGEKWIARALEIEPRELNLRAALVSARLAQKEIPEALEARDALLRAVPQDFSTLARAAKLSDQIAASGDEESTLRIASWAANAAQTDGEVSSLDFQKAALLAARNALYANKPTRAAELYNGLADEQWPLIDRAVVLIDWENTLRDLQRTEQADQIAKKFQALGLSPRQQAVVRDAWEDLN